MTTLRVACDPDSFDHRSLTSLEFEGQNIEIKNVSYVHISRLLKNGEVDMAVWTSDQRTRSLEKEFPTSPIRECYGVGR